MTHNIFFYSRNPKIKKTLLGQNLREGAEEIEEIELRKERVPFASNVFGRVPTVDVFGTSIRQNSNYIKMTSIDSNIQNIFMMKWTTFFGNWKKLFRKREQY